MKTDEPVQRPNFKQGLAKLDRLAVVGKNLGDNPAHLGLDLVHDLHCLNDADNGIRAYLGSDFHIGRRFG